MASKNTSRFASVGNWLRSSRWNILAASVLAVGLISAVAIFAAEPETGVVGTSASCPESVVDWADENGWTDPNSYTCDVNYGKGVNDPQAGAIAPDQFANINSEAELTAYLNSDDPEAQLIRQQARDNMTDDEYTAWVNGSFVAVQFLQEAEVVGAAVEENGEIRYPTEPRFVPTGDVTFAFVDPNEGEEVAAVAGTAVAANKSKKPAAKGNLGKAAPGAASKNAKSKTKKNNKKKPAATGGVKPPAANNPAAKDPKKKKKGKVKQKGNIRKDCGNINANIKNPGKTGYLRVVKFNDKNGNAQQDEGEIWNNADGQVQFKIQGKHNGKAINLGPYTAKVHAVRNNQVDILVEGLPVGEWTVTEIFNNGEWTQTTAGGKVQKANVKDRTSLCGVNGQKRCDVLFFGNQRKPGVATATPEPTTPPSASPSATPTTPPSGTPGPQGTVGPTPPDDFGPPPGGPSAPQGEVKGVLPKTGTSGTIALVTVLAALALYGAGRYVLNRRHPKSKKR